MRNYRAVILSLVLAAIPGMNAGAAPDRAKSAPMYRVNIEHTGYCASGETIPQHLTLLWKYSALNKGIHNASKSSPAVDESAVYVGSDDGYLYAFDRMTGVVLWRFETRRIWGGIHSSPAVDDENVYVGAYDGYLYAVNKKNGKLAWEKQLGDGIGSSPLLFKGRLYIGVEMRAAKNSCLVALRAKDGSELFRSIPLGGQAHCSPSLDPKQNTVYIGCNSNIFFAFDADSGALKWKYRTDNKIKSTAALAGNTVIFTSWDRNVYALNTDEGLPRWKFFARKKWQFMTAGRAMSSPAVDEEAGMVYVGSHDGTCYGLDLAHGWEKWAFHTNEWIMSSPVVATLKETGKKAVIVGSDDTYLYVLDAADGHEIASYALGAKMNSSPVIKDGIVYVSTVSDFFAFK